MIKNKDISFCLALFIVSTLPFLISKALISPSEHILGNPQLDNPSMFYFLEYFSGHLWREGTIPLWNPYIMLGVPFISEGQAAIFHPMQLLFAWLPTAVAYNLTVFLAFIASALAFYGYLRSTKLSPTSAFLGAFVWNFSTVFISRIYAGHLTNIIIFPLLPLFMLLCELWHNDKKRFWVLPAISLTYGLMILSSHPQFLFIFSLFILIYEGGYYLSQLTHRTLFITTLSKLLKFSLAVLVGIGIGAVYLLPAYDFIGDSFRTKTSFAFASSFSFAPENLLTLLCPKCFGYTLKTAHSCYWGRNFLWEMWLYIGIAPLFAAILALFKSPARIKLKLLMAIGLLFLYLALGRHQPTFSWLLEHLPVLSYFRGPSKFSIIFMFCLVIVAAHGFEALFTNETKRPGIASFVSLLVFISLAVLSVLTFNVFGGDIDTWKQLITWRNLHGEHQLPPININNIAQLTDVKNTFLSNLKVTMTLSFLSLIVISLTKFTKKRRALQYLLIVIVGADLFWFTRDFWTTFPEKQTNYPFDIQTLKRQDQFPVRILQSLSYPNSGMKSMVSSPLGYTGNTSLRYNTYINHLKNNSLDALQAALFSIPFSPQVLGISLDYVVDQDASTNHSNKGIQLLTPNPPTPRYFIAESTIQTNSQDDALEYLLNKPSETFKTAIIEGNIDSLTPAPIGSEETITVNSFNPNKIELKVKTSQQRLIVLNEMYDKGWKAYVNSTPTTIYPTNYLFRGLIVPSGESAVTLEFLPDSFIAAKYISLFSLGIIIVVFIFGWRLNRQQV